MATQVRARATAVAAALVALSACGGSSSSTAGTGSAAGCAGSGDITIGVIAPKSGPAAALVGDFANGAQVAAEDVNKAGGVCGGRHVKISVKDNAGDFTKDQGLAQQLVEQEGAKGVVMIQDDDYKNAGAYLQSQHVLDVGAYVSDEIDNPNTAIDTFSVAVPQKIETGKYVAYFTKQNHVKTPGVLYETTTSYGRLQAKAFCDALQAAGAPCVSQQTYTFDQSDVTAQIANLKSAGADSLLIEGFTGGVPNGIATARAAGITGPILGTGTTATLVNIIASLVPAPARRGYEFIGYTSSTAGTATAATALATRLGASSSSDPLFVPMFAYDSVRLIARGWKDANSLDADAASAAIESVNAKQGTEFFLHDAVYSAAHHEPQVDAGALTFCVPEALDNSSLAKAAPVQ